MKNKSQVVPDGLSEGVGKVGKVLSDFDLVCLLTAWLATLALATARVLAVVDLVCLLTA